MFQLLDFRVLSGDDPIYQIADGDDSGHPAICNHWQMPHAIFRHQAHAFFHGIAGGNRQNFFRDHRAHLRGAGGFALQGYFASVIALGEDAQQPSF